MRTMTGVLGLCAVLILALYSPALHAIPAFARQYQTSCTTCHSDFPKLNDFGKAFKDAGFKFPVDNDSFLKIPATLLGAPAQKDQFPHVVWPGSIPGILPVGLRMNTFFQKTSGNRGNFDSLQPAGTVPSFIPKTDFSTGFFSIFTAGDFGSDIGRVVKLPKDTFTLRVGQFELDLPFTQARSYNISPYDIYTQANGGIVTPG